MEAGKVYLLRSARGLRKYRKIWFLPHINNHPYNFSLDTACSHSRLFPSGTTATCRQHYTYRRLVAISQDGRQTITDDFKFPSCCKCMLSDRGGGLYSRFGGQDAEPQQPRQTSTTQRSETTLFTFSPWWYNL